MMLSFIRIRSSGTISKTIESIFHCFRIAAKTELLNSIICPDFTSDEGFTISLPVGISAATGLLFTVTFRTPAASIAPMAAGSINVLEGKIISPAHISSPICLTCCHGEAAVTSLIRPSSSSTTSSIITTESKPSGSGSPVSTRMKSTFSLRSTGVVSVAPNVSFA